MPDPTTDIESLASSADEGIQSVLSSIATALNTNQATAKGAIQAVTTALRGAVKSNQTAAQNMVAAVAADAAASGVSLPGTEVGAPPSLPASGGAPISSTVPSLPASGGQSIPAPVAQAAQPAASLPAGGGGGIPANGAPALYWCIVDAAGCGVTTVSGPGPAAPAGSIPAGGHALGPYPSQIEANAACATQTCAPPPGGGAPPPVAPVPPAPPAPPVGGISAPPTAPICPVQPSPAPQWFCFADASGTVQIFSTPPNSPQPGWVFQGGPYATSDIAVASCPGPNRTGCGPANPIPNTLQVNLVQQPRMGSENWCKALQATLGQLAAIGNQLAVGVLSLMPNPPYVTGPTADAIGQSLAAIPVFGNALCKLWYLFVNTYNPAIAEMVTLLNAGIILARSVTCDNANTTVAILLVRAAIQAFKRIQIGANAGIWATVNISIEWDQVDAMLDYMIKYSCPYGLPGVGEVMDAWKRGLIKEEDYYRCLMMVNNADPDIYAPVLRSSRGQPGIGDRQQFLYRLQSAPGGAGTPYNDAQYEKDLVFDGFTEEDRNRLFAIRYKVYQLREIRQLMDTASLQPGQLEAALKAEGFGPDTLPQMVKMEQVLFARKHETEIHGYTLSLLAKLWQYGQATAAQVTTGMARLGYTAADAQTLMTATLQDQAATESRTWATRAISGMYAWLEKAYKAGLATQQSVLQALTSVGAGADSVNLILQTWDGEQQLANIAASVACVKRGWQSGYIPQGKATMMLVGIGVNLQTATGITSQWAACRNADEDMLSAQQDITAYASGLLTPAEALSRLVAKGYNPDEAEFLIAEQEQKLQKASMLADQKAEKAATAAETAKEKANAATEKAAQVAASKAAAAAVRLAKTAAAAQKAAAAEINRLTPLSLLKKLLTTGQISQEAWIERTTCMGYTPEQQSLLLAEYATSATANIILSDGPQDVNVPPCPPS